MFFNAFLYAGVLPLVSSAAIAFVMRQSKSSPRSVWSIAIAGGFIAAQFGLKSQSSFANAWQSLIEPHEAADWLPLIVLLAIGVNLLMAHVAFFSRRGALALAAIFSLAVPVRLLSGNVRLTHQWSAFEKLIYLAMLAATLGVTWLVLSAEGDEQQSVLRLPLLILVAAGTAVALTLSGVFGYGLSSGAIAAALTGTAIALIVLLHMANSPRFSFPGISGAAGVITFSLGSLIILGHFFAELTILNATLLFASLAATAVPLPHVIQFGPKWRSMAVRASLCISPLVVALALTASR